MKTGTAATIFFVLALGASGCGGEGNKGDAGTGADLAMSGGDLSVSGADLTMTGGADLASPPDLASSDGAGASHDLLVLDFAGQPSPDGAAPLPDGFMPPPKTTDVMVGANGMLTFSPDLVTIKAGDGVRWVFSTGGHDVVSGVNGVPDNKFCSPANQACANAPPSPASTTYTFVFANPGTYPYFCSFHVQSNMKGTVIVQ